MLTVEKIGVSRSAEMFLHRMLTKYAERLLRYNTKRIGSHVLQFAIIRILFLQECPFTGGCVLVLPFSFLPATCSNYTVWPLLFFSLRKSMLSKVYSRGLQL